MKTRGSCESGRCNPVAVTVLWLAFQVGITSWGADDPTRFLAVTNWQATFTRTLQSSGTYPTPCVYSWSFSHSGGISSELKTLIPPLPGVDPVWSDVGNTNISLNFSIQDRSTETCGDDTNTYEASGGTSLRVGQSCSLTISVTASNYTLQPGYVVGPYTATVNGDPFPGSVVTWFPPVQLITNPIVEPLPASGMELQGSRRYSLGQLDYQDAAPVLTIAAAGTPIGSAPQKLTGELVLTWTLTPLIEEVEVVVESDDYENWLPLGDLRDWNKAGTNLFFTARLQTKDGQVPQSRAKTIKFELLEVSSEPGVCMNRPTKQSANNNPDLRFESRLNQPPFVVPALSIQDSGMTATTPDGEYAAVVAGVSSFDFGAYGKLKVTAEVNGREIVGYWKNDPAKEQKPLLLPKRKPDSHIADKWKEDEGATDLPDNDDDENEPVGDTHKGDGLTLYEEYRGFSQNLEHLRASPKKKDLFITDKINTWRSKNGIELFAAQSGLKVHSKFRDSELTSRVDSIDRWINFNVGPNTPHVVDQHGLVLVAVAGRADNEAVSSGEFEKFNTTPASVDVIEIGSTITAPSTAPPQQQNIEGINSVRRDGVLILTDFEQASLAHEIAHGCSVWHHGDCDKEFNWEIALKIGDTNPPPYIASEQGLNIVLEREPGVVMRSPPWSFGTKTIRLGVPQGQHSGAEDCFMRYAVADAYAQRNSNVRFWVRGDELKGIFLCDSPNGTGVNTAGRTPQSRYGNAAGGRGDCKGQICVNDRYLRDSLHSNRETTCP